MDKDDEDSIDSILTEIETSLQSTYPETGENENQVFSAFYEDQRTVGYGRKDDASFMLTYNNPFDPRLMNGMLDGTENKIETLNQTTKASSLGPTIINDNYNSQQNIKNNTNSIYTRVQNPILPNPYPRNNEFQGIQPKPLDQSSWSHQVTDQIITPQIIQQANYGQIRTNQGNNNYGMTKTSTNNYLTTITHQQKSNLHQDLISNWYVHQGW
ncbi:unnamed protein product [Mytilus edulis]|uniref:Uncharacterized protein n=1 Tax=Mytilus edulis TaxID=6550 RepID=A0A8S3QHG7_MYTED|nr:unnamed protein product [Mytilus edulis]